MADVELVIKIPEEIYKYIMSMQFYISGLRSGKSLLEEILKAIRTGTPLPKGHGKLIDEPTEEDIAKTVGGQNDFAECIRDAVKLVFDNASTLVNADKEGN